MFVLMENDTIFTDKRWANYIIEIKKNLVDPFSKKKIVVQNSETPVCLLSLDLCDYTKNPSLHGASILFPSFVSTAWSILGTSG